MHGVENTVLLYRMNLVSMKHSYKLVLIQNCQIKVYRCTFRQFTVHQNENQLFRAQGTRPRGGYRYVPLAVTVYLFLAKIRCFNSQLPNKGIPVDFSPVYGIFGKELNWHIWRKKPPLGLFRVTPFFVTRGSFLSSAGIKRNPVIIGILYGAA